MAQYKLTDNGVLDTVNNMSIPNDVNNRHWNDYQQWVTDGGVVDPADVVDPWITIRNERDIKLAASDFTQLGDAALPGASTTPQWVTYRQALRDIPTTYAGNPGGVVWPTEPS